MASTKFLYISKRRYFAFEVDLSDHLHIVESYFVNPLLAVQRVIARQYYDKLPLKDYILICYHALKDVSLQVQFIAIPDNPMCLHQLHAIESLCIVIHHKLYDHSPVIVSESFHNQFTDIRVLVRTGPIVMLSFQSFFHQIETKCIPYQVS